MQRAKEFGILLTETFSKKEITPYFHVLIYHVGFFREKFGGLERFGNFGIENRHQWNKLAIPTGTSHFSQHGEPLPLQLLKRSAREMKQTTEGYLSSPRSKRRKSEGWSSKTLQKDSMEITSNE